MTQSPEVKTKNQLGFTLLELLVVIAIIAVLAGIVIASLNYARSKGRDSKRIGDARQIVNALEQYYAQYGVYPTGSVSSQASGALLSDPGALDLSSQPFVPDYLPMIPSAPTPQDGSCSPGPGKGNNNYWYEAPADGSTYTLTICIGSDNGDWLGGVRTLDPTGLH